MRKLCYSLTWAYFFAVPWDHSLFFEGLGPISRTMTLITIPFIAVAVAARGKIRKIKPVHLLMIMFLVLVESTFYWTVDPDATLTAMRTCVQVMIVVWFAWEFAVDSESRRKLGVAYMLGSYVSIVNTFWEFATNAVTTIKSAQRFSADGWDRNDLAVTLALGILISRYVAHGASKPVRILAFAYLPLSLVAIALTGSRAGSIVAAVAVLAIVLQWKGRSALTVTALGILLTCAGLSFVPEKTLDRILSMTSDIRDMNSRVPIWRAAASAVPSHLLFGTGAGTFRTASGTGMVAHNTFLSVLLEEGLTGLALFLAMIAMLFRSVRQANPPARSIWTAILICWCIGVSSLTWEQTRLTWVIFALAAAQGQAEGEFAITSLRVYPRLRSQEGR
jgi:O-antigen ligase